MTESTATVSSSYNSPAVFRCSAILEVNAANREELVAMLNNKRYPHIRDLLEDSIFDGHAVLYTVLPDVPDELCEAPHFGHNVNCDPETCDGPGIYRLFGTTLYLAAAGDGDVFGRYELTCSIQLDICGKKRLSPGSSARSPIGRSA